MLNNIFAYIIKFVVEMDEDGSYYVHCPGLGGVHVSGDTEEEALERAKEVVQNILEIRLERGETLPESDHVIALRTPDPISLKKFRDASFLFPVPPPYLISKLTDSGTTI
jgi:predicted RNase H-like HicB family nuclease